MLTKLNSLNEAAEWLTKETGESWTWKQVISRFTELHPETVHVAISANTPLYQLNQSSEWKETTLTYPILLQVCQVEDFLQQILLGNDLESACGLTGGLISIDGSNRFRKFEPIPATAIRLTSREVADILTLPPPAPPSEFYGLMEDMRDGKLPKLRELLDDMSIHFGIKGESEGEEFSGYTREESLFIVNRDEEPSQRRARLLAQYNSGTKIKDLAAQEGVSKIRIKQLLRDARDAQKTCKS
jgi:hypothetical protein